MAMREQWAFPLLGQWTDRLPHPALLGWGWCILVPARGDHTAMEDVLPFGHTCCYSMEVCDIVMTTVDASVSVCAVEPGR